MKNVALILSAGIGQRMKSNIPKQFIELNNKPIIMHTLEKFDNITDIDKIYIVCLSNKIDYLKKLLKKYSFKKEIVILPGGKSGIESTYNGIKAIYNDYKTPEKTYVIIHDANRPIIDQETIHKLIQKAYEKGNAVCAIKSTELIFKSTNNESFSILVGKDDLYRIQKPECYQLKELKEIYDSNYKKSNLNYTATCDMFLDNKKEIFYISGKENNLKLTYPSDLKIMEELLKEGEK